MGFQTASGLQERRVAISWMLQDLRALERMLADEAFETGVRRIGAEQEMFLVDASWRPAPGALEVLAALDDPHFTTEVGAFNLELNLDPQEFTGDCLSRIEAQLDELLALGPRLRRTRWAWRSCWPGSCRPSASPTWAWRTWCRTRATWPSTRRSMDLRGQDYELHIKGIDELRVRHDSVMVEACNASFQVHLQVAPAEFANLYNVAQLLAGPVLACATNSPVLFGKRLWAETRIALFEQSVDTRRPGRHLRERSPRVTFGTGWVRDSVTELYREDITRHRPVLAPDDYDDPFEAIAAGRAPNLSALLLHTGTVWRWNRACYGVSNGVPHLRIENRVLPSGPSTVDEVANAAFWLGLMRAVGTLHHDVSRLMEFEQARANLVAAGPPGSGGPPNLAGRRGPHRVRRSPSTTSSRWPPTASTRWASTQPTGIATSA